MRICFKVRDTGKPLKGYIISGKRRIYVDGCAEIDERDVENGFVFVGEYRGMEFEYRFDEPFSKIEISEKELLYESGTLDADLIKMLIFSRINDFRHKNGVEKLKWSRNLEKIADLKAELISKEFSHNAFGRNPYTLLRQNGIYFVSVGENIYRIEGLTSRVDEEKIAEKCVEGWMSSRGHRRVLLEDFSHCGVGVYARGKKVFIVFIAVLSTLIIESEFNSNQTLLLQPVDEDFKGKTRISVKAYPERCFSLSYPEYAGKDDFVEVRILENCRGRVILEYLGV